MTQGGRGRSCLPLFCRRAGATRRATTNKYCGYACRNGPGRATAKVGSQARYGRVSVGGWAGLGVCAVGWGGGVCAFWGGRGCPPVGLHHARHLVNLCRQAPRHNKVRLAGRGSVCARSLGRGETADALRPRQAVQQRMPAAGQAARAQAGTSQRRRRRTSSPSRKPGDTPKVAAMLASVTLLYDSRNCAYAATRASRM